MWKAEGGRAREEEENKVGGTSKRGGGRRCVCLIRVLLLETERDWPPQTAGHGLSAPVHRPCPLSPRRSPYSVQAPIVAHFIFRSEIEIDPYLPAPRPRSRLGAAPSSARPSPAPHAHSTCRMSVGGRPSAPPGLCPRRGRSPMQVGRVRRATLLSRTPAPHDHALCLSHRDPLLWPLAQPDPHLRILHTTFGVALGGVYPITPPTFPHPGAGVWPRPPPSRCAPGRPPSRCVIGCSSRPSPARLACPRSSSRFPFLRSGLARARSRRPPPLPPLPPSRSS